MYNSLNFAILPFHDGMPLRNPRVVPTPFHQQPPDAPSRVDLLDLDLRKPRNFEHFRPSLPGPQSAGDMHLTPVAADSVSHEVCVQIISDLPPSYTNRNLYLPSLLKAVLDLSIAPTAIKASDMGLSAFDRNLLF